MNLKSFLVAMAVVTAFSSCTVTKRRYMGGFHIESKGNGYAARHEPIVKEMETVSLETIPTMEEAVMAEDSAKCDIIRMIDGTVIEAKVEEITDTHVKYRKCSLPTGPLFNISLANVDRITFTDGTEYVPDAPDEEPGDDGRSDTEKRIDEYKAEKKVQSDERRLKRIEDRQTGSGRNAVATVFWIMALVFVIMGIFIMWLYIPALVFSLLSVIFGGRGIGHRRQGLGIAALVIGILLMILALALFIVALAAFG